MDERNEGECEKVLRELELIKHDVSKLKLDMAFVLEENRWADKQRLIAGKLNQEIEEINEKHVLVELARIEAVKELQNVEEQRREDVEKYMTRIEEMRKKKQEMAWEMEDETELKRKLEVTTSDVVCHSRKLKQVKGGLERNQTSRDGVESDDIQEQNKELQSVMARLEAAKKELNSVKEESFQFMTSMDVVRNERKQIGQELEKLRNKEKKSEMAIENLKSKLLRSKFKLEAASAAEDKAKSMALNISITLQQLQSEAEATRKEHSVISEETAAIRAEIQNTETEKYVAEERLQDAQNNLREAKSTEATALENLRSLTEKTMRNRASTSRPSSRITISKFEYEYLIGHAAGAKQIADKKVAAAQAWIEALKASEKETNIKAELLRRQSRELQAEEERVTKRSMSLRRMVEDDFEKWRESAKSEKQKPGIQLPRNGPNRNVRMTPTRRGKARTAASPLVRGTPRSTPFTIRRRRKAMPNLTEFFGRKCAERHP